MLLNAEKRGFMFNSFKFLKRPFVLIFYLAVSYVLILVYSAFMFYFDFLLAGL